MIEKFRDGKLPQSYKATELDKEIEALANKTVCDMTDCMDRFALTMR